jgi:hypothetical protein
MDIVTLREFSRRIGVSLTAVQKGVKTGRLQAVSDPKTGRITGIDFDTQATAWTANSKAPQRKPNTVAGGRPRLDGAPPAAPSTNAGREQGSGKTVRFDPGPRGGSLKRESNPPPKDGGMSLAEVQRARELVKLQLDNLKLKEANGELVRAADQHKVGFELGQTLIGNLYNMPERLADEFAGMSSATDIHKLWVHELDLAVAKIREKYGH